MSATVIFLEFIFMFLVLVTHIWTVTFLDL